MPSDGHKPAGVSDGEDLDIGAARPVRDNVTPDDQPRRARARGWRAGAWES